jgi:2-oxoglutarate ferredoxin oxidoreductase subunit delta
MPRQSEVLPFEFAPIPRIVEVFGIMGKIIVNRERCKACGLCTLACPKKLIVFSKEANSQGFYPAEQNAEEECTGCALCAEVCPDVAIEVWR